MLLKEFLRERERERNHKEGIKVESNKMKVCKMEWNKMKIYTCFCAINETDINFMYRVIIYNIL